MEERHQRVVYYSSRPSPSRAACAVRRPLHLGLGRLYRRTETHEQPREHITIATTMYREIDMRFFLEQAEMRALT